MEDFCKSISTIHAYLAVIAIMLGICTTFVLIAKAVNKAEKNGLVRKLGLFSIIAFHTQLILGLVLYFTSVKVSEPLSRSGWIKIPTDRLYVLEHPLMMILGIVFITLANVKIKRAKYVTWSIAIMYFVGIVLILSRLPYSQWLETLE